MNYFFVSIVKRRIHSKKRMEELFPNSVRTVAYEAVRSRVLFKVYFV